MRIEVDGASAEEVAAIVAALELLAPNDQESPKAPVASRWRLAGRHYDNGERRPRRSAPPGARLKVM
jgi:hypothetical protein